MSASNRSAQVSPLLVMGLPAGAVLERRVEGLVVAPEVADLRGRDHVVAADEAHLVLDVALLVAGVGVAEPRLEAVVQPEPPEQLRLGDDVVPAPPGLGRVVEHDDPRHAAYHVEGVLEPLADADVLLVAEHLAPGVVGIGERHGQEVHPDVAAVGGAAEGVVEVRLAEIDLHRPRVPMEPHVPVLRGLAHGPPHLADLALHGRVRSGVAFFRHQPVVDPSRGVALLVVAVPVRLEHLLDIALEAVQQGRPPRAGLRPLRGEVVDRQVLPDRRVRVPGLAPYLRRGVPEGPQIAYPLYLGHV